MNSSHYKLRSSFYGTGEAHAWNEIARSGRWKMGMARTETGSSKKPAYTWFFPLGRSTWKWTQQQQQQKKGYETVTTLPAPKERLNSKHKITRKLKSTFLRGGVREIWKGRYVETWVTKRTLNTPQELASARSKAVGSKEAVADDEKRNISSTERRRKRVLGERREKRETLGDRRSSEWKSIGGSTAVG